MTLRVVGLRTEYMHDPSGIDALRPRLGWLLDSDARGAAQSAFRVLVASEPALLEEGSADVWDSGKVRSDRPGCAAYGGPRLQSGRRYVWKAKAWDQDDCESQWSEPASWSMGMLSRGDWKGRWIGLKSSHKPTREQPKPAVCLRGTFRTSGRIRRAVVYCAVLGAYELYANGKRIADGTLLPEWTDYGIRLQYQAFDVTDSLGDGDNALALLLGHGWYSGYIGMFGYQRYGQDPRALLQLNIEYEDGSLQSVVSGTDWKASFGALLATDFHMGETYDARLEQEGWTEAGFDDGEWQPAQRFYDYKGSLNGAVMPPIRSVMTLAPAAATRREAGRYIVDMGQNMVGRLRLRLAGPAGSIVTVRHGEMLDANGELYTDNLRLTRQTDTFILGGGEREQFEPHFTLHGFRYAEISGCGDDFDASDAIGVVYSTALTAAGFMTTSNPLLNRLLRNIEWTQRGNFVSVPTDCPQRDERLGWSGDAQVFFRTACYCMDAAPFFTKWLTDLTDAQRPTGAFTDFAPFIAGGKTEHGGDMTYDHTASAGWGDAGILVPWMMYQVYGDTTVIERHYDAMARWIAFLSERHPGHLREDLPQFGDWLSLAEAHGRSGLPNTAKFSTTPYDVFGTAYYAHSADLLSRMAAVIGRTEDAERYADLFGEIKAAFKAAFVDEIGRIKGDTQSAYALALAMKLLPERRREYAVRRILELLEENGWHMTTGIHGTKHLLAELAEAGREDAAYRLLNQQEYPSWFYSVLQGATTIWERWDGWTEERGFQRPGMNSFNHYALGAVGEWLYRYVGGIDLDEERPGFRHIRIRPRIGGGLDRVECRYDSIAGPIRCSWRLTDGRLELEIGVPAGSTASVRIPRGEGQRVIESGVDAAKAPGVTAAEETDAALLLSIGSGVYRFVVE
ncbi:family 78 glycoside hydrolase catalytic domain [Paenibacillus sacheonensis]|uniref:alpha-L-rhamnosidase n=1 Tax=Paenibacillus sacheonensis TaxID=742054 RepID=A0A7X4YP83_9BACL|nr:family 78 glycoside hydrolase catalytic domain [Paenibacillus sacheonensis]MBM7565289.1 alpha-L-rhamnosidase [Paenibacillus sacheonensis]NBC69940.1 family 78 glycoside hydrolase catalytic domain [Paenibacillus sacheonensis]